jgi:acyl-coenzyme A synthetase/AMP-(fatty) acid ligase
MLDPEDNQIFCERNQTTITEVYGSTETGGIASRNRAEGEENFTPFAEVDWKIKGERLLVRSPYISAQAERDKDNFFLTGDRVTAVGNNGFQLLGRMDGITKVGGKRVDLAEIREIICSQPKIADCFVLALPAAHGRENCIAALVQPVSTDRFDRESLISSLQQVLEPHALPRIVRTTEAIPMTGAGKYALKTIRQLLSPSP